MKALFVISFIFILSPNLLAQRPQGKADSEKRVALVIGNSSYATGPLKNPVNDAQDIERTLRELRFDVIDKENLSQNDMKAVHPRVRRKESE